MYCILLSSMQSPQGMCLREITGSQRLTIHRGQSDCAAEAQVPTAQNIVTGR